jgi:hypothetical protein
VDVLPPSGDLAQLVGNGLHPTALPQRKQPVLPPPIPKTPDAKKVDFKERAEAMKKTLEKLLGVKSDATAQGDLRDSLMLEELDDGTFVIDLPEDLFGDALDDDYLYEDEREGGTEGYGYVQGEGGVAGEGGAREKKILDVLKAAGYDVLPLAPDGKDKKKKDEKGQEVEEPQVVDEL